MRIQYKISYSDFVEGQKAILGARLQFRWILGGVFILLGLVQVIVTPDQYPAGIMFLVLGCVFAFCWRLTVRRMYRKDDRFKHTYEVVFSETGVDITGPTSASQHRWENFIGYKQTKSTLVLLQSSSLFNCFPKSAFTPEALSTFEDLVVRHVPPFVSKGIRIRTALLLLVVVLAFILLIVAIRNILRQRADENSEHTAQAVISI